MKLMRVGDAGAETPCVIEADGTVRDVSTFVEDFTADEAATLTDRLASVDLGTFPTVDMANKRVGAPLARPKNIWCIGLNYSDHAAESGMAEPEEPIIFNKASASYCGPSDPILKLPGMTKLDWEVELGIFIGKTAWHVSEADALDHVLGFALVNDVSERAWQLERGGQWVKGKAFPNSCPTGPWIVTPDEVGDPQALGLTLSVNGTKKQDGNTANMIFGAREIVSYMSRFIRLEPGDLICTGTPAGVGMGFDPQEYLDVGDTVSLAIDKLGEASQTVEAG